MPTYEYKREDGTIFEIRQGINDEPLATCPDTGQKVKRMISGGGGVVYKGDGWYVTDYKNNKQPANGSSDGSSVANNEPNKQTSSAESGPGKTDD